MCEQGARKSRSAALPRQAASGARAWWWLLLPLVLSAALRGLWAPDEPRYAQVAREAWEGGDLLVLQLCGEPYTEKPPLLFWVAGAFGALGGWEELWLRIPSLLSTAGSAWLVGRLARRLWGGAEAAWAPALYLTSAMVLDIGGRLQIDPLLAFLTTASLYLLLAPGSDRRPLAGVLLGLGLLAKGPVALVHVVGILVVWRWLSGEPALPRFRARGWLALGALALLPLLLWLAAVAASRPELALRLIGKPASYVASSSEHAGPPWKPGLRLLLLLLPWTPLVLAGLREAWRGRPRHGRPPVDRGLVLAATWLATEALFFTLVPAKRDLYLLPAYPAAALLAARCLTAWARRGGAGGVEFAAASSVILLATALLPPLAVVLDLLPEGGGWRSAASAAPGFVLGLVALRCGRRGDARGWGCASLAAVGSSAALAALLVLPLVDPLKSARALALSLAARPERPSAVPCVGVHPEAYRYYGRVPAVADRLAEALELDGAQLLALVRDRDWPRLAPDLRRRLTILEVHRVGSRGIYVVGAAEG